MSTSRLLVLTVGRGDCAAVLSDALQRVNADVVCVADAEAALGIVDLFARQGRLVDIAFISSRLHNVHCLIRQMRAKDIIHCCRIIVFGVAEADAVTEFYEDGANSAIGSTAPDLCLAIEHWLSVTILSSLDFLQPVAAA